MSTIPPLPCPTFNLATLVNFHADGSAAALVAMHRPGGTS